MFLFITMKSSRENLLVDSIVGLFIRSKRANVLALRTQYKDDLCHDISNPYELPSATTNIQVRKLLFILVAAFFTNLCYTQTTINIYDVEDAYIDQTVPNGNFGSAVEIRSKPFAPSWSERFLLKFDLSSIPVNASIISANVVLTVTSFMSTSSTIRAYRINDSWSESSVTWSNFSNDYEGTHSAQKTCAWPNQNLGSTRSWNLLSDVQEMHSGIIDNNGWLFRDKNLNSSTQAYWNFGSSENVTASNRPVLQVTYTTFDPLPVELIQFDGICIEGQNLLSWQTASEHNSATFEIEYSKDGNTWSSIHSVEASGFSTHELTYTYIHTHPSNGDNYYRLNQYDIDGTEYSYEHLTINIHCKPSDDESKMTVYPNPSSNFFNLVFNQIESEGVREIKVLNAMGQIVLRQYHMLLEGEKSLRILSPLGPGIYFAEIDSDFEAKKQAKFIIE